jgi:hypothetical protein
MVLFFVDTGGGFEARSYVRGSKKVFYNKKEIVFFQASNKMEISLPL